MNLFGNGTAGDGSNVLLRNIAIAGGVVLITSVIVASSLDNAGRSGALNRLAGIVAGDAGLNARLAGLPKSNSKSAGTIGIRYGKVDYTTTASVPGQNPRFKNVITNPALGMPK